jgi:hypothetical protein
VSDTAGGGGGGGRGARQVVEEMEVEVEALKGTLEVTAGEVSGIQHELSLFRIEVDAMFKEQYEQNRVVNDAVKELFRRYQGLGFRMCSLNIECDLYMKPRVQRCQKSSSAGLC